MLIPDKAKSDLTQKKLMDEINPLETDLRKLTLNHREAELELRGRKFRLETEVEGLIAKYDDVSNLLCCILMIMMSSCNLGVVIAFLVHDNTATRD